MEYFLTVEITQLKEEQIKCFLFIIEHYFFMNDNY